MPAGGATALEVEAGWDGLAGPGWRIARLSGLVRLDPAGDGRLDLRAHGVSVDGVERALSRVRLHCADLGGVPGASLQCARGEISAHLDETRILHAPLTFTWTPGHLSLDLSDGRFAGGTLNARATLDEEGLRLGLEAAGQGVAALAEALLPERQRAGVTVQAGIVERLRLQAGAGDVPLAAQVRIAGLTAAAASGNQASEGLDVDLDLRRHPDGALELALAPRRGELYLAPVYLGPAHIGAVRARVRMMDDGRNGVRYQGELDHGALMRVRASATAAAPWMLPPSLELSVTSETLQAAFEPYLQPAAAMAGFALEHLSGAAQGALRWHDGGVQHLRLEVHDGALAGDGGRLELHGIEAAIDWGRDAQTRRSSLSIGGGRTWAVPLGPFRAEVQSGGARVELLSASPLPVFDGALELHGLSVQAPAAEAVEWRFAGALTPVSMEQVSAAFGWPVLSGTASGVIPEVRWIGDTLVADGVLQMHVFGGEVELGGIVLERPLGPLPRLAARVDVHDLDLELVTRTFDIGRIEGRIEGRIHDLVLENWLPARFDAWFATPPGSAGPRRISQRAVETLSAIGGGGASAVLSRGFLGLFQTFNYRRLGISCRLHAGVCEMDGVAPAGEGYYLVEGSGLPRIDVIAYNRRVDWGELVARLAAAVRSEGPIVR